MRILSLSFFVKALWSFVFLMKFNLHVPIQIHLWHRQCLDLLCLNRSCWIQLHSSPCWMKWLHFLLMCMSFIAVIVAVIKATLTSKMTRMTLSFFALNEYEVDNDNLRNQNKNSRTEMLGGNKSINHRIVQRWLIQRS